jgi:crossover junction endodeoxyribonuclease RuvC
MRVLGLDPGSRRTGWGVVESSGSTLKAVAFGLVTPPTRCRELSDRLLAISRGVGARIDEHRPDAVVVEEAFYHESVRSTLVLGHVRGVLLVAAAERGVSIAEYSPREIKMSVAGNGGASKEQVAGMVRRLLGLRTEPAADAADALAAAICHVHRARRAAPARALTAATRSLEALLARRGRR